MEEYQVLQLVVAILFEFFGPIICLALLCRGGFFLYKAFMLHKSLTASKGNSVAMQLELLRIKGSVIRTFSFLPCALLLYVLMVFEFTETWPMLIGFLLWGGIHHWGKSFQDRYNEQFKENFVAVELEAVFSNLQYEPAGIFNGDLLKKLDFFTDFTQTDGSDLITAEYKGKTFIQGDIRLQELIISKTRTDGEEKEQRNWHHVFSGRVMRFALNSVCPGPVQVVGHNFASAKVSGSRGDWQTVETELAAFGDVYEVFAKDPLDAMRVLTPQMIEVVFALHRAVDKPAALYFTDNSMYVFLASNRDAFDTSKGRTLLEERTLLRKDIALVTSVLDALYDNEHRAKLLAVPGEKADAGDSVLPPPAAEAASLIGNRVRNLAYLLGSVAFFIPLGAYLTSVVVTLSHFPMSFPVAFSSSGKVSLGSHVPTLVYLVVASIIIVPVTLLAGGAIRNAITIPFSGPGQGLGFLRCLASMVFSLVYCLAVLTPFWIHLLFLYGNI